MVTNIAREATEQDGKVSTAEIAASDPRNVAAPPPPGAAPTPAPGAQAGAVDWERVRADFPLLRRTLHGKRLVFLDSTATSQKPQAVLDAMDDYYRTTNANIHRGVYELSEVATDRYEKARARVARFINAKSSREIIYTRNATEAINLVAYSWARANLVPGDVVLLSKMEHHSNLVPWHMLAAERGITLRYLDVDAAGLLVLDSLDAQLEGVKLLSVTHMSNVLGTINPVEELIPRAHAAGALVMLDAAQSVPHLPVDVQALDVDFLVFSGHKMCGPTGIGVLYGKRALLEAMPAFLGGGDMIGTVTLEGFTPNELPWKFEAGTPAIAEAIGLGAAVDYLSGLGMANIHRHEQELTAYALDSITPMRGVKVYGPPAERKGGVVSFEIEGVHPHDIATILDGEGICIRAGHHCCQPLMHHLAVPALARASFYLYTTTEDVDALVEGIVKVQSIFGV
ncbi:MAG TPA: cysteine desulfurase [Chloroflexia bacterium]|nr:cysteine desulfurase [Chloroflexia bacterium]